MAILLFFKLSNYEVTHMAIYFMILHAFEPKKIQDLRANFELAFWRQPDVTSTAAKQNQ